MSSSSLKAKICQENLQMQNNSLLLELYWSCVVVVVTPNHFVVLQSEWIEVAAA